VGDDAAKKEWADDVERRLREVRSQIDPGPLVLGYTIGRRGNVVVISTVSRNELSEQEIAALSQGQWPCWDEIVKAVPEFIHAKVGSTPAQTTSGGGNGMLKSRCRGSA
jgi:hypothetical protein